MRQVIMKRILALAVFLALAGCGSSSNSSPSGTSGTTGAQSQVPVGPPIVVPSEAVIAVTLDQTVSTKNSAVGDPFAASLAAPVVVDGRDAIPQGAKAGGHITVADQAGRVKGGAQLVLNLDSITVNGQTYQIHTAAAVETGKGRGKRTAIGAGGGAAVGAIVGAIAGGGKGAAIGAGAGAGAGTAGAVFTGNRDISVPAETKLNFKLTEPLQLPAQ